MVIQCEETGGRCEDVLKDVFMYLKTPKNAEVNTSENTVHFEYDLFLQYEKRTIRRKNDIPRIGHQNVTHCYSMMDKRGCPLMYIKGRVFILKICSYTFLSWKILIFSMFIIVITPY